MFEGPEQRPGLLARLTADPIRLRRWARVALAGLVGLVIASRLLSGNAAGWLLALAWVCAPLVAFAIGFGDAFFVRHGRGRRRLLLTVLASISLALVSCVVLAGLTEESPSRARELLIAGFYGLLYGAIVLALAGLLGWGIGRGEQYVTGRIERLSDEEW